MSETNNIEGVPEGWRLVRIGKPKVGEWFIGDGFTVCEAKAGLIFSGYAIVERIEPPKLQYRPFVNAEEFKPYRDRWWCLKSDHRNQREITVSYDDTGLFAWDWKTMFEKAVFEDGTPFGIEVVE
jgi:hypothetical protein